MGVVMQAQRARLGTSEAVQGATVFNGDNLATELTGLAMMPIGLNCAEGTCQGHSSSPRMAGSLFQIVAGESLLQS